MNRTNIIADISLNHMGNVDKAKKLIDAAKDSGCDSVKLRSYDTEKIARHGTEFYNIMKTCEFSYDQQVEVKAHADANGVEFVSAPYDENMLFFLLERLGIRRIVVPNINDIKLMRAINSYAKVLPALNVIISTGTGFANIERALGNMKNVSYVTIMHHVDGNPVSEDDVNLAAIGTLRSVIRKPRNIGYTDRTSDVLAPALSVLIGATVVEKCLALNKSDGGFNSEISADPQMMTQLVEVIRVHENMMGSGQIR